MAETIGRIEIETKSEVPQPAPRKKFMVWIGPVMMTVALGLGTSEVILYPNLTARFGVGWLGLMVFVLFLQTVWAQELARWTVVSGEHAAQGGARVLSRAGSLVLISAFMFFAFAIPAWATAAASALREMLGWPVDVKVGTVFWAYVTSIAVFLIVFFSRVARRWIEHIATWSTVFAWVVLIVAAVLAIKSGTLGRMFYHLVAWDIPKEMDWWVLGSTLAWVGAGPTLIWYTYWMRDAGWGMAKYADPMPGWLGAKASPQVVGCVPDRDGGNVNCLRTWIRRSHGVLWIGYFLGSLFTIFIFVGLSDSILRPSGLVPSGFDVVKHQAQFFAVPLGRAGYFLFLLVAWLLFVNTQLTIAEALVRQNADATWSISARVRKWAGEDIKRVYFLWWIVYLVISFVLIGLQYFVRGANPFSYVTSAAMLSFVTLIVSMAATFAGTLMLYRRPILAQVRPKMIWVVLLGIGLGVHIYLILRAAGFFFKFWR